MSVQQQAVATLLDKGVKVRVTAPLLFRLFGKQSFSLVLRAPSHGTIDRINDLFLSTGIAEEELQQIDEYNAQWLYKKFGRAMCKIVAVALINSFVPGKLLGPLFGRWLYWHLSSMQLITFMNILVALISKEAFMSTIKSVSKMTTTTPNLSPTDQGS